MAKFEVHIPAAAPDLPDITLRVVADNWMAALKTGMEKVGEQGVHISNILCDIVEDGSFDITDPKTGRVFRIRELKGVEGRTPPAKEALAPVRDPELDREEATDPELDVPGFPPDHVADRTQIAAAAEISSPRRRYPTPEPIPLDRPTSKPHPTPKPKLAPLPVRPLPAGPPRAATESMRRPNLPSPAVEKHAPQARAETPVPQPPSRPVVENRGSSSSARLKPRPTAKPIDTPPAEWETATTASYPKHELRPVARPRSVEQVVAPSKPIKMPIGRVQPAAVDPEDVFAELFERVQEAEGMEKSEAMYFFLDLALEKIAAESGSVLVAPLGASDLRFAAARGPKAEQLLKLNPKVPLGKGIAGFCTQEGVSVAISDAQKDKRFLKQISTRVGYETRSMICAPMAVSGKTYGCLQVINKHGNAHFEDSELAILSYLAHQAAKYVESHVS